MPPDHGATTEPCVICLCPITERAVIHPCNHLAFDFLCLASWLDQRPSCPLCNRPAHRIDYDWRSPHDHKTYLVSRPTPSPPAPTPSRPARRPAPPPAPDAALSRRRLVHARAAYSRHQAPRRVLTPAAFRACPALQRRARLFLRRELRVFSFLAAAGRRLEVVLEYVVGMLCRLEIKGADGAVEGLVAEVLGREGARLLLHELAAWLGSSCQDLGDWDRHVQYADPVVMRFGQDGAAGVGSREAEAKGPRAGRALGGA